MKEEKTFELRSYGRQELALHYFRTMTPDAAWRKLRHWLHVNPRLRHLAQPRAASRTFTPREVQMIVDELGEP